MTFDARPVETIRTGGSNGGGAASADADRNLPVHLIRFFHFTCGVFKGALENKSRGTTMPCDQIKCQSLAFGQNVTISPNVPANFWNFNKMPFTF